MQVKSREIGKNNLCVFIFVETDKREKNQCGTMFEIAKSE